MLLAVDIGNTQIVIGLFDGERLERSWRLATRHQTTADEFRVMLSSLLGVTGGILRAEIHASEGQYDDAVVTLEHAIEVEDALRYDEPEPLNFSARHWLGALLLELDRPVEAEQVYRVALADHPRNGWSLLGLEQALRVQGKIAEANRVHDEFNAAWARADVWIRSSRF